MTERSDDVDVAIVGGGIAGIVAAYRLSQQAPHLRVALLEREQRWGGKLLTDYRDGFVLEGGADSFLASKPEAWDLCRELGLEQQLISTNEQLRRTFVVREGSLVQIPEGLSGLVPARLEPFLDADLLTAAGKERVRQEPATPRRTDSVEETLASFIIRRFGQEVYDRLIEPLMSGIYAGDGNKLSVDATFPQLRRLEREYGSVIQGMQQEATQAPPRSKHGFLTPRRGFAVLIQALQAALPRSFLRLGMEVTAIRRMQRGYAVSIDRHSDLHATSVVLAVPAHQAATLVTALDTGLADLFKSIPYISTATVVVGYPIDKVKNPLSGFGYLVPRSEGGQVLACTWTSSKFVERAPAGHVLLRAFVGRAGQEEIVDSTDANIEDVVRAELQLRLDIRARPEFVRIYRWPKAMPQYVLGHVHRLALIRQNLERFPGLSIAGHAYGGVGIPDCIRSGSEAAATIIASYAHSAPR